MSTDKVADIFVYGGTPAGVASAVVAARRGVRVILVNPHDHLGGIISSGVNTAETENMDAGPSPIAGFGREFTEEVGRRYDYGGPLYFWESHTAEQVFEELCAGAGVTRESRVGISSVSAVDGRIRSVELSNGRTVAATHFVDCSYEGDLMALAGVTHVTGRESGSTYGESLAGIRINDSEADVAGSFGGTKRILDEPVPIDPFASDSTLLYGIETDRFPERRASSELPMSYNYRLTLSTAADRVPIGEPGDYSPEKYELFRRWFRHAEELGLRDIVDLYSHPSGSYVPRGDGWRCRSVPGEKWELNNRQAAVASLAPFGLQRGWTDRSPESRALLAREFESYTRGLLYFLAHDPAVPPSVRRDARRYGLAADEYVDNDHWPYELYVREGRRMVGRYVMTEHDLLHDTTKADAIAVATHKIDSHHCQRIALGRDGFINEGRIWISNPTPFQIPYRAMLPKADEVRNLLVPVALSASHVAYCAIRLELQWMLLGHAAGLAAALALDHGVGPDEVPTDTLREWLAEEGVSL